MQVVQETSQIFERTVSTILSFEKTVSLKLLSQSTKAFYSMTSKVI